jgi:thiosulfate dehydrogenase
MNKEKVVFALVLVLSLVIVGAGLSAFFSRFIDFGTGSVEIRAPEGSLPGGGSDASSPRFGGAVTYHPPAVQEAPLPLQEAVTLGYQIVTETRKYAARYVGNGLECSDCHFRGGITQGGRGGGISLVGVAATYPASTAGRGPGEGSLVDLVAKTNLCLQTNMNGKPLSPQSKEMRGILAYYQWISKGLPIYEKIPWLGLKPMAGGEAADQARGAQVYAQKCSACHGRDGKGTQAGPPLWGPQSFGDGATLAKPESLSAFTHLNMPLGNPDLTQQQAMDVGLFAASRPRPHFSER